MLKEELEKIPDTTPRYVEVTKWRCPKCKEGYELDKIQKCAGCNFLFDACEDKDFNALIYSERIKVSNSTDKPIDQVSLLKKRGAEASGLSLPEDEPH
jgi:polyferredoxin